MTNEHSDLEAVKAQVAAERARDWTIDPETGRSNSSPGYRYLVAEVARLIRSEFRVLDDHGVRAAAALIMAQLAHKHGLRPVGNDEVVVSRDDLGEVVRMSCNGPEAIPVSPDEDAVFRRLGAVMKAAP